MSDDEKVSMKVPIFTGKKKDWKFYRTKMRSYLAQKGLSELFTYTRDIERDDKTWTEDEKKTDAVKKAYRMRSLNRKAAGILMSSIDTDTELGKSAFGLVEAFCSETNGHAGGLFLKSWEALMTRYEDKETIDEAKLKKAYYNEQMKEDAVPHLFIDKMKKMRKRLEDEVGYKLTDEQFMKDVLARLPTHGDDEKNLGPYQVKKLFIDEKIKDMANKAYTIQDMERDLTLVHEELYGKSDSEDSDDEGDDIKVQDDKAMPAFTKQFKGLCRVCGKMGHMGKNCPENQGDKKPRGKFQGGFRRGGGRFNYKGGRGRGRGFGRSNGRRFDGKCHKCGKYGDRKSVV